MTPFKSLSVNPQTINWDSRADVQNLLALLESNRSNKLIDQTFANLVSLAGMGESWPLESRRATSLVAKVCEQFKGELIQKIYSSHREEAAGAFGILLEHHTTNFEGSCLGLSDVNKIYTEALKRRNIYDQQKVISENNQLSHLCTCWLSVAEFQGAEICASNPAIRLSQDSQEMRTHDYILGRSVLQQRDGIVVLGMSVGSSRFNASRTEQILEWLDTVAPNAQLMITDRPARYNRMALGESAELAEKYCLKKGKQLREYAAGVLSRAGNRMEIFNWDAIYSSSEFQASLLEVKQLFDSNEAFKSDVRAQSERVLAREANGAELNLEKIDVGTNYLLEEFAALDALSKINQAPVVYAYYTDWKPFQMWVCGEYDGLVRNLGFVKYDQQIQSVA